MFKKATTCAILYVCGTFTLAFKFFHQISQIDDFCRSQNTLKGQLLSNIFQARKGYGNGFTYHAQIHTTTGMNFYLASFFALYIHTTKWFSEFPTCINEIWEHRTTKTSSYFMPTYFGFFGKRLYSVYYKMH